MRTDNAHEIRIKGAGLELPSVTVSCDNPIASISFTQLTGPLHIACIVPCLGTENLAVGVVHVVKPKVTGAPGGLTLELSPRADGNVRARAPLKDANGNALTNVP